MINKNFPTEYVHCVTGDAELAKNFSSLPFDHLFFTGSTKIGKSCLIGGQVGIAGHLTIGDRVKIQAQSGIGRDIKDDEMLQGSPAIGYSDYNKSYIHFKNLPKTMNIIHQLEKKINNG